ncbi:hypothetical protein [Roseibium aggregatum]|uniref:hypothetical protein n=1 Tax=Roseibium aggregatum TaxID=187304 RepID=UPI003A97351A
MKVLMIHGIGQEGSTQKELLEKWTESLHKVSPGLLANAETRMAYYGTTLANWANGSTAVGMGTGATDVNIGDADEIAFLTSALQEAAEVQNLTDADIASAAKDAAEAVAMDSMTGRFLVGLVRALEKISPLKGSLLLRVVKQGHTSVLAWRRHGGRQSCQALPERKPASCHHAFAGNCGRIQTVERPTKEWHGHRDPASDNNGITARPGGIQEETRPAPVEAGFRKKMDEFLRSVGLRLTRQSFT